MARTSLLTISEELELLVANLDAWAQARGGRAKAMTSMARLWEEIYATSDAPRILVCYNGENSRGGYNRANLLHRVERLWIAVVLFGTGFNTVPGTDGLDALETAPKADGTGKESRYDSLERIRERIRVMPDITEELPVDYKSIKPVPNAGPGRSGSVFLDAYAIEFSTANDIPGVTTTVTPA